MKEEVLEYPNLTVHLAKERYPKKSVKESIEAEVDVISFTGRIDDMNSYKLNHEIHALLLKQETDMILNLESLEYANSIGIAAFFSMFHSQKEKGKRTVLCGKHTFLKEIFQMIQLPPEVLFLDTVDEAKKALL